MKRTIAQVSKISVGGGVELAEAETEEAAEEEDTVAEPTYAFAQGSVAFGSSPFGSRRLGSNSRQKPLSKEVQDYFLKRRSFLRAGARS